MKEIQLVTIKPLTGEVEYGVREAGHWLRHGEVIVVPGVGLTTTLSDLAAAATADAQAKGYL